MNKTIKIESALNELESIVKSLETDIPLDEAIKSFEKGVVLSKTCLNQLKLEKGKLAILVDDVKNLTEDFDI